jgi:hypothetical protein
MSSGFENDLDDVRDTDAYAELKEQLTDEQIVFVWNVFQGSAGLCGLCWNVGPYCCYDSVVEYD